MRLNAFLARAGVASRRGAEDLIRAGRVTVNGTVGTLATVVGEGDAVALDGERVAAQRLRYVLLHKPRGVVTTAHDPEGRRTVLDLVAIPERIVPVGRLDVDTTGVLLLTNDGQLAYRLAHPRFEVEKAYLAEVEGAPSDETIAALARGVELEDGVTAPAVVRRRGASRLELVLHEGRNRQVRRMCEAVGHPVQRLERVRYAGLDVRSLRPGAWRDLEPREVVALHTLVGLQQHGARPNPGIESGA